MKRRKPLALMALGILGVATVLAVANALWFQVLTINASATTGTLKVQWDTFSCNDNEPPDNGFSSTGWPDQTKDVGSFVSPKKDPVTGLFPDNSVITITNGYPGYGIDCEVHIRNVGTVPIHVEREVITIDDPSTPLNPDLIIDCTSNTCKSRPGGPQLYLPGGDPIYAEYQDNIGCQLHPEEQNAGSFLIGVRQAALEHHTYVVTLHVQVNQWNESGWVGCQTPETTPVVPVLPLDPTTGLPCDPILLNINQEPCINPTATPPAP